MFYRLIILSFFVTAFLPNKSLAQQSKDTSRLVIYDPIPESPVFPGGDEALRKFIQSNLRPIKGASGKRLFISFTVERNGTLTHFKIWRGISKEANNEAIRVMRLSPKWKPVAYDGQAHVSGYTVPIMFPK